MTEFKIKRTRLIDNSTTEQAADASTVEQISRFNGYLSPSEVYHSLRLGKVIYGTFSKWERA